MLIDTPQMFAAMVIGICAFIGMFALSILRSSARSLSTLLRLTLTSDVPAPTTLLRAVGHCASGAFDAFADIVGLAAGEKRRSRH